MPPTRWGNLLGSIGFGLIVFLTVAQTVFCCMAIRAGIAQGSIGSNLVAVLLGHGLSAVFWSAMLVWVVRARRALMELGWNLPFTTICRRPAALQHWRSLAISRNDAILIPGTDGKTDEECLDYLLDARNRADFEAGKWR